MIVAFNAARGTSNKALIKKVIGLVVVVAVCVVVVIVVSNVLKTFGDSDDDSQEGRKFEGESLFKANLKSNCFTTNTSELFLYHQSSLPFLPWERRSETRNEFATQVCKLIRPPKCIFKRPAHD